jgi:hypothetical protein
VAPTYSAPSYVAPTYAAPSYVAPTCVAPSYSYPAPAPIVSFSTTYSPCPTTYGGPVVTYGSSVVVSSGAWMTGPTVTSYDACPPFSPQYEQMQAVPVIPSETDQLWSEVDRLKKRLKKVEDKQGPG